MGRFDIDRKCSLDKKLKETRLSIIRYDRNFILQAEIDGRQKAIAALQKEVEQYPEKQQKLELLSKTLDEAWLQRKQSLTEAHQLQLLKARARAAEDWLAAKEAFLNNDDLGADLDDYYIIFYCPRLYKPWRHLIRKHQEFSKILESQHGRVGELETFARGLLTDGHGDAAYIQKRLDEVLARAERLEESCARRSRLLQQSRQLLQLAHDLQQERDWIERKAQFAADTSYMYAPRLYYHLLYLIVCAYMISEYELYGVYNKVYFPGICRNLQSKMQKQTAFEAELAANKGRIDAVASKGEELIGRGTSAGAAVARQLEQLEAAWRALQAAAAQRRLRLQQALQARVFLRALDDFCAWLQDVEAQLLSEDHGQDLRSTQALLAKHARLEQQAAAKKEEPAQLAETAAALAADSHFLAEHLVERADAALTRYRQLQEPMQSRRDNLEDAELLHRWERDADDELAWLKEREAGVLSEEAGASLADTQALLKKHIAVEAEIAAREPSVKGVCSRATQLARRGALRRVRAGGARPGAAGRVLRAARRGRRARRRAARPAATCCRYYYCYLSRAAGAPRALRRVRAGGARPGAAGRLARRGHFAASALEARGRALLAAYCALHDAAAARAAALRDRRDLLQVLLLLSKSCSWRAAGTSPRPRWRRAAGRCWPRTARCTTRPPRAPPRCATAATCCRYYYCYLSRAAGAPRALRRVRAGGARPGAAGRVLARCTTRPPARAAALRDRRDLLQVLLLLSKSCSWRAAGHFAASALEARGRALLAAYCALHDAAAARAAALRDRRDLLQVLLLLSKSCSWRAGGHFAASALEARGRALLAAYCALHDAAAARAAALRDRRDLLQVLLLLTKSCSWRAAGTSPRPRWRRAAGRCWPRTARCTTRPPRGAAALRDRRDLLQVLLLLSKSCSWRAAGTSPRSALEARGRALLAAYCALHDAAAARAARCATAATCCRYYYCYLSRAAGAPRALRRVRAGGARPGAAGRVLRAARRGRRARRRAARPPRPAAGARPGAAGRVLRAARRGPPRAPPRCATAATCCRYYYCYLSRAAGAPRALRRVRAGGARPGAAGRVLRAARRGRRARRRAARPPDLLQVLLLLSKSCSWRAAGTSPRPRWRRAAGRCWPRTARCTTRPPRAPPRCATAATCCRYYYCYLSRAAGAPRALRRVRAGGARPGAAGRVLRAARRGRRARRRAARPPRTCCRYYYCYPKSCSWRAAGTSPRPRWRRAAGRCWPLVQLARRGHFAASALEARGRALLAAYCALHDAAAARAAALRDRRDLLQVLLLLSKSCSWRAAGTSPRPRWRRAAGRCWPRTARCTTRPPRAPPRCATAATCCRYYYCYLSRAAGAPRALRRVRAGGRAAGRCWPRTARCTTRPPPRAAALRDRRDLLQVLLLLSKSCSWRGRGHFAASALEARGRALLAAYCALHDAAAARAAALRDRRDLLQVLLLLSKSCSWRAAGTSPRPRWRRAAGRCWPRTARCTTRPPRAPPRCATAATCCREFWRLRFDCGGGVLTCVRAGSSWRRWRRRRRGSRSGAARRWAGTAGGDAGRDAGRGTRAGTSRRCARCCGGLEALQASLPALDATVLRLQNAAELKRSKSERYPIVCRSRAGAAEAGGAAARARAARRLRRAHAAVRAAAAPAAAGAALLQVGAPLRSFHLPSLSI
ncbi:hypothetical protein ACJJTC_019474 [Scirpophaga incertulas]